LYQGPVAGFAGDTISLGRFRPGESGNLVATVHLPGPETGNDYQGKTASVKWIFTAQTSDDGGGDGGDKPKPKPPEEIEVPPEEPPIGPPEIPPEPPLEVPPESVPIGVPPVMPKTGEEAPTPFYLLGGLALLAGTQMAWAGNAGRDEAFTTQPTGRGWALSQPLPIPPQRRVLTGTGRARSPPPRGVDSATRA